VDAGTLRRSATWTPVSLVESARGSEARWSWAQASRLLRRVGKTDQVRTDPKFEDARVPTSASCAASNGACPPPRLRC
jgi:hypothetical protein